MNTRKGLGTVPLGPGAHDDEVVETRLSQVGLQALGVLVGDVYANLFHDLYCVGVNLAGRLGTRAVGLERVATIVPQESLGHLASRRVLGTQEDHLLLLGFLGLLHPPNSFSPVYETSTVSGAPPAASCSANSSGNSLSQRPSIALSR